MIITVSNLKGGVAKTTTAVYLAHLLGAPLVDTDPQGSATEWATVAREEGTPLAVPVISLPTANLAGRLPAAEHVVIDTPPAEALIVTAAMSLADLVVVPTAPSALDVSRVWATLDIAKSLGKPAVVLLTRVRRTRSVALAADGISAGGTLVLDARIPLREVLALAWGGPVRETFGYEEAVTQILSLNGAGR